jgi:hypothetical protein
LFVCSIVCLFVFCLFACSFVRPFICLFVRSFVRLFVRSFVCLFVRSFVRSFVRLFVCSFVCSFVGLTKSETLNQHLNKVNDWATFSRTEEGLRNSHHARKRTTLVESNQSDGSLEGKTITMIF